MEQCRAIPGCWSPAMAYVADRSTRVVITRSYTLWWKDGEVAAITVFKLVDMPCVPLRLRKLRLPCDWRVVLCWCGRFAVMLRWKVLFEHCIFILSDSNSLSRRPIADRIVIASALAVLATCKVLISGNMTLHCTLIRLGWIYFWRSGVG